MDLVYFCKYGENEELRYSLRSAVKNLPHDNVWVVGGKPDWYTGNYIETSNLNSVYRTVRNNITIACNDSRISDDFILMNDDFFTIAPIDTHNIFYNGTLEDKIKLRYDCHGKDSYISLLESTNAFLKRTRKIQAPLDYELHVPMQINKEKMLKIIKQPYLWRSLYGNVYNIGGTKVDDVKVYSSKHQMKYSYDYENNNFPFLSSDDQSFSLLYNTLKDLFPDPCIYEN